MLENSGLPTEQMLDEKSGVVKSESKQQRPRLVRILGIGCLGLVACIVLSVILVLVFRPLSGPKGKDDKRPVWSADGSRIAFDSNRDGNWDVYLMNADGTGVRQLTSDPFAMVYLPGPSPVDIAPSLSHDGTQIAFESGRDNIFYTHTNNSIYVMKIDGSAVTQLTDHWSDSQFPVWSPDGERITFISDREGSYNVFVMNADGSNVTQLTHDDANNTTPAWSPDGKHIVFASFRDGKWQIDAINADGSNRVRLSTGEGYDAFPVWSPTGNQIAFVAGRGEGEYLYLMNSDGTNSHSVTTVPISSGRPAWSPDGTQLLFASNSNGYWNLYRVNANGSDLEQLTGK